MRLKRFRSWFVAVLSALVGAVVLSTQTAINFDEQIGLPWLFAVRGELETPPGLAIVAIDDATVDWLQRSSANLSDEAPRFSGCLSPQGADDLRTAKTVTDLPRDFYACLINTLKDFEPSLIVMDVNFSLPKASDDQFAAEIRDFGSVILIEGVKTVFDDSGAVAAIVRERPSKRLLDEALDTGGFHVGIGANRMTSWYLGDFRPFVDIDSIPVVAARHAGAQEPKAETFQRVWFYGPPGATQSVSARTVLKEEAQDALTKGGVIFIGYHTLGLTGADDHFPVPITSSGQKWMSGVEIAATAFLNLRDGHVLREPAGPVLLIVKFLIVLLFAVLVLGRPLRRKIYLIVASASILIGVAVALFLNHFYLAVILSILVSAALAIGILLIRRLFLAQASTRALAPAQIADQLMDGSDYSGNTGEASVLFLDLIGSTTLAQSISSEEYARTIRAYYGIVGDQVQRAGGVLLEVRGDGILASFQRDTLGSGYAKAACKAVLGVRNVIDQRASSEREISHIHVRCGLASGEVTLSSASAGERVVLTVAGDTVNAAARIEELGKILHQNTQEQQSLVCLVDETTRIESHLPEEKFSYHGEERLRGRSVKTNLYELKAG